ncbi:hypothetical protein Btru_067787 [Bulinus truncatus]|nr:hypothetical protein Btru_067787 [Bulinus truncatus]
MNMAHSCYSNISRGTLEFMSYALSHDREFPPYWTKEGRSSPYLIDVDDRTSQAITDLVEQTWGRRAVGEGRDARGLDHEQLVVTNVVRVENTKLFGEYRKARRDLLRKQIRKGRVSESIAGLGRTRQNVLTTRLLPEFMKEDLYHEINEHYVFHGTTVDRIGALTSFGFNPGQSSDSNMLGSGVYGAENSIKADQYADPAHARSRPGHSLKLILSRMLLGDPLVLNEPSTGQLPPQRDSIIGDGPWMFREFVVKNGNQVYPEYVITYERN